MKEKFFKTFSDLRKEKAMAINMKKVFAVFFISFILITVAACNMQSTTQKYLKSYNNTMNAKTMQVRTQGEMDIDLSGASEQQKETFEGFKDITLNIDEVINNANNRMKSNYYFSTGDYIVNMKLFTEGDMMYLKFPNFDSKAQYIRFDMKDGETLNLPDKKLMDEYGMMYDEIKQIWEDVVRNEIIANQGNSIESTPDGEIKVNLLSFELNDEKVKNILKKIAQVVSKNEAIRKHSIEMGKKFSNKDISKEDIEKGTEDFFNNLNKHIEEFNESFILEELKLTAKVDKDMYIIDELLEGKIVLKDGSKGEVRVSFEVNTTRWNINRDVEIDIPEISEDEIINKDGFGDFQDYLTF